ncbi:MAG: tetratricopeptide repeat protein [Anaerolineae bacterium]|nr:tetratricopeptide repeat protein [Anaerolineae bacterium]
MRFCGNCGTHLSEARAAETQETQLDPEQQPLETLMGSDLLERFRAAGLEASGQRRNVTVLFVDLTGYTPLTEKLEPDVLYELMQKFIRVLANDVYKYDGMVDKLTGDGLMALFGAPLAYENNAERAVRSAFDMIEDTKLLSLEFREQLQGIELGVHCGINNGTVIVGGIGSNHLMNYTAIGDTVNIAHRLEEVSQAGQVLVSENIFRRVQPLFDFHKPQSMNLKGIADPVTVYEVIGPKANPGSTRGLQELGSHYIGHESEIRQIDAVLRQLVNEQQGGLILVTGEAGIGKSRLMREVQKRFSSNDLQLMEGHTLTYRKSIPYWIFQDMFRNFWQLKQFGGELRHEVLRSTIEELLPDDVDNVLPYLEYIMGMEISDERVKRTLGLLEAEQLQLRIFLAVRRILVTLSHRKPLMLVLDDLHWADESSLELMNFLVDAVNQEPILIYGISRPFEGGSVQKIRKHAEQVLTHERMLVIELKPLAIPETEQLFNSLLSMQDFPVQFRQQIVQRSAGMPLYMEEILRMLIEDNVILFDDDIWKMNKDAQVDSLGVPDTLQALILTRFDRLNLTQRHVIQAASVIGNPFSVNILEKMLPRLTRRVILDTLNYLTHHEFIEPMVYGLSRRYRFRHGLVADAIYSTLLVRERKSMHQLVAEAIESLNPDHLDDQIEMLAHHYSRSYQEDRALHYLVLAGKKAMHDFANEQARQHFVTALSMLSKVGYTTQQAYDIQTGLGDILVVIGEYPAARRHYATALEIVLEDGTAPWLQQQSSLHRRIATTFERQGDYEKALGRLQAAEMALKELSSENAVEFASIYNDIGWIHFRRGNVDQAESIMKRALDLVRDIDAQQVVASIYNRLGGIYFIKGELDQSSYYTRLSLELREQMGEVALAARSYNNLGLIAWKRGQLNDAMENFQKCFDTQKELGDIEVLIELNTNLGLLQMEFGRPQEAERYMLEAIEMAKRVGHSHHLSTCYVHLAQLYLQMDDFQRALEFGEIAAKQIERMGGSEFKIALQVHTGMAQLGLGNLEVAKHSSREALKLLRAQDENQVGLDDRAVIFQLLGKIAQAEGQNDRARYYYERGYQMLEKANRPLPAARILLVIVALLIDEKNLSEASRQLTKAELTFISHHSRFELGEVEELRARIAKTRETGSI